MPAPEYATPEEIAEAVEVHPHTIRRECRAGRVPGAIRVGRSWVIPVADAEAYVRIFQRYGRKSSE